MFQDTNDLIISRKSIKDIQYNVQKTGLTTNKGLHRKVKIEQRFTVYFVRLSESKLSLVKKYFLKIGITVSCIWFTNISIMCLFDEDYPIKASCELI